MINNRNKFLLQLQITTGSEIFRTIHAAPGWSALPS